MTTMTIITMVRKHMIDFVVEFFFVSQYFSSFFQTVPMTNRAALRACRHQCRMCRNRALSIRVCCVTSSRTRMTPFKRISCKNIDLYGFFFFLIFFFFFFFFKTRSLTNNPQVISDSHKIATFPRYLLYWKKRLLSVPLTAIASQIRASDSTGANQPDQLYYLLSDILPEDRITRLQLARDLLNEMLEKQQEERTDKGKARPCLFCRQAPRGRDELFEHMRDAHGFAVGQPDNLVGIDRLLDLLRAKLDGLQCIYCFPESDHEILTNRGFWRLADVEAHLAANAGDWADVRVASYDERSRALVYETPKQLVVNAPDAADAALIAFKQTRVAAGVDVVVTRGHNMFVRCETTDNDGQSQLHAFEKATAERVVAARSAGAVHDVRVLAAPTAGVKQAADLSSAPAELVAASSLEERARFLAAYGARLAANDVAMAPWVWQLDGEAVRPLLAPLDGAVVRCEQLRDDVARAAMHAGVAATFAAAEPSVDGVRRWRVRVGGECEPSLDAAHYLIGGAAQRYSKDRTWCFEMPSGFVVVRRRSDDGAASQATIQGNCERIFKDYATLRMHMKKKRHFKG
jgi:hypothetical protein